MRKPFLCCPSYDFGIRQSKNVKNGKKCSATEDYITYTHTRHIRKVRAVSLYLNIGGSEQSCTHAAPSIECLRSH